MTASERNGPYITVQCGDLVGLVKFYPPERARFPGAGAVFVEPGGVIPDLLAVQYPE
jgi:hypothetical protein